MLKKLLFPLILITLFQGCVAEEFPVEPDGPCLITSLSYPDASTPKSYAYQYNDKGQIEKIRVNSVDSLLKKTTYDITLDYDSEGRLIREASRSFSWDNVYNNHNQLIRQDRSLATASGTRRFTYLHSYNDAGQLTQTTAHPEEEADFVLSNSNYYYTDGVLSLIVKTIYSEEDQWPKLSMTYVDSVSFKFDGKRNPLPSLPIMSFDTNFGYNEYVPPILSKGNIVSCRMTRSSEFSTGYTDYTVSYIYNLEELPVESIIMVPGGYTLGETKRKFNYTCD